MKDDDLNIIANSYVSKLFMWKIFIEIKLNLTGRLVDNFHAVTP